MVNRIYINRFHHVNEIVLNGITYNSVYNYNYYYDDTNNVLILEECNDDMFFMYSIINGDGQSDHLGNYFGNFSIFDEYNRDYVEENSERYVEVDTNCC